MSKLESDLRFLFSSFCDSVLLLLNASASVDAFESPSVPFDRATISRYLTALATYWHHTPIKHSVVVSVIERIHQDITGEVIVYE